LNISRRRDEGDLSKKEKEFNNVMKEFKEKNVRELIWGNKPQEENIRVTEKDSNRELQGTHHIHKTPTQSVKIDICSIQLTTLKMTMKTM